MRVQHEEFNRLSADSVDAKRPISSTLESLRRQALACAWLTERARLESLLAFMGALASLASHFHAPWAKGVIVLCILGACVIVITTLRRWRAGRPSLEQVAARLQRRYESFDGLLTAALEFEQNSADVPDDSQELRAATRTRAADALRDFVEQPRPAQEVFEVVLRRELTEHTRRFWQKARIVAALAFVLTLLDPQKWKSATEEDVASPAATQVITPSEQLVPTDLTPQQTPQEEHSASPSNEGANAQLENQYLLALRVFREDLARARALIMALNVPTGNDQAAVASLRLAAEFDTALWDSARSLTAQATQILQTSRDRLNARPTDALATGRDASTYLVALSVARFLNDEETLRQDDGALAARYADLLRAKTSDASTLQLPLDAQRKTLAQVDANLDYLIDALEIDQEVQSVLSSLSNLFDAARSNLQIQPGRLTNASSARSASTQRFLEALEAQQRACESLTARIDALAQKTSPELDAFFLQALADAELDAAILPEISNLGNSLTALRQDAELQRWGRVATRLENPWALLSAQEDDAIATAQTAEGVVAHDLATAEKMQTANDVDASEPSLMARLAQRADQTLAITLNYNANSDMTAPDAPRGNLDAPGVGSERLNAQGGAPQESFAGAYDHGRDFTAVQSRDDKSFLAELPPYARKSLETAQKWRAPQETLQQARQFRSALTRYERERHAAAE